MVICKFHLQGNCRYGSRCWNDHIETYEDFTSDDIDYSFSPQKSKYTSNYNQFNPPRSSSKDRFHWRSSDQPSGKKSVSFSFAKTHEDTYSSNRFSSLNQPDQTPKDNKVDLKSIADDLTSWKISGQWLFTCYGPVKNKSCFPGLEDISQEELRWGAYQALNSGNFDTYVNLVKDTIAQIQMKREEMSRFSPEICQILEKIHQGISVQVTSSGDHKQALLSFLSYGGQQLTGLSEASAFSFKSALNQVNDNTLQSGFFQAQQQQVQQYDTSNSSNFSFAAAFAKHSSGFGETGDSGFGFSQQTSAFGHSNDSFSNVAHSFGREPDKALVLTETPSSFKNESESSAYTSLDELDQNEKEQFMSQTFTLGKIPIRPPPIELCY